MALRVHEAGASAMRGRARAGPSQIAIGLPPSPSFSAPVPFLRTLEEWASPPPHRHATPPTRLSAAFSAVAPGDKALAQAAKLLGVDAAKLAAALVVRVHEIHGGETVTSLIDVKAAAGLRDALAKATFSRLFGWLVSPYTAKVRAHLAYKRIPFVDASPSAAQLNFVIKPAVGRMIMPTVRLSDGSWRQDSARA